MKNTFPKYFKPISSIDEVPINVDSWYEATDAFDEKKYHLSIRKLLDYIHPNLIVEETGGDNFKFSHPQGSSIIYFEIKDEWVYVQAPFLKINENTNKVALLRAVAELNFTPLMLSQIELKENELWFFCKTKVSLCQPYKLYNIIREIAINSDENDDDFIEKYDAEYLHQPQKQLLTAEEHTIVWQQIQDILLEYTQYQTYFQEKRWAYSEFDMVLNVLFQIGNMSYIHGVLKNDIGEYISNMLNTNIDFNFRLDKGKTFVKQLISRSETDFFKDIYHANTLISLKWRSNSKILQEIAQAYEEQVIKHKNNDESFNLSFYLQYMFLRILYYYMLDSDYKKLLENTLSNAAGKDYNESARILSETFYHLLNETLPNKSEDTTSIIKKTGFFSKLFS